MDRKSITILVVCFLLLFSWPILVNKVFPPKPLPPGATNGPTRVVTGGTNAPARGETSMPPATLESTAPVRPAANTNVQEQTLELTNSNAHYNFSSYGGGLKLVELLNYPETVYSRRQRRAQPPARVATLNSSTPAPTLALLDGDAVQGDGIFKLSRDGNTVRAEKTLENGLAIIKEFQPTSNYLVMTTVRLENRSDKPLTLPAQEWFVGTATPMNAQDDGSAVGVTWYNGAKSQEVGASYFSSSGFACIPRTPPAEYRGTNVAWAAAHNQFFALAVMPADPAAQIVVRKVSMPPPTLEELAFRANRQPVGYEAMLVYPGTTLAAGEKLERKISVFAGPKEYRTLAGIAGEFNNNIDLIMGYSGFFGFFSKGLLLGMNWLHNTLSLSYGWAIIAITLIIKIVFWPLTQASTRSAKRMQALQPQIKQLQEKYKDDPVKAQRKTMEFWKEHKVNPMSGCLPTLIQMPVFIGFFYMIRSAIELRGASWFWVSDLSRPDTLFMIPALNFPFNLLPLIMGVTMLWQAHLTPPSPGMDPTQAKLMRYMPLMFMVFLYNFSAGLTLYWTVQNLLSIVQTKLTRTRPEPTGPAKGPQLTSPPKKRK